MASVKWTSAWRARDVAFATYLTHTHSVSNVPGSQLAPGSTVAGYQVEALIGRGGMGVVYRASEEGLGRKVALKVIAPEFAQDERFRERFLRESRIAASLDHPHVIPIYQAGEDDGLLFQAMRYVEGYDLAKLLAEEGALEPRRALDLLGQIAEALDAAHEKGLIHRDVKPSNVLIAESAGREHCYLGDFGLTKRTGSLSGISAPGDVVGTLEYVAPEQITGDDVEARADLYSLGCVLYECLTGQPPFPRATDVALLWAHVHEEAQRPSDVRSELPKPIDPVLGRALAKEPARRFETAGELVSAARSALGLVESAPAARPAGRSRWAIPVAAGVAVVIALGLAFALLRDSGGGLSAIAPNSVGVLDPGSNRLVTDIPVGIDPESVAIGEGAVWVANVADETVSRIDPVTRARGRTIDVGDYPSDLVVGGGTVWVALGALAELTRINPEQDEAATAIPALGEGVACGAPRASLAVGGGAVWFACEAADLGRIDIRTGRAAQVGLQAGLLTSASSVLPQFSDIAFGLGSLWIVNRAANSVVELDPATIQRLRDVTVGQSPTAIAVGAGALWVANFDDDTVTRVTVPGRGQTVETDDFEVGDGPVDVAVGEGAVWVVSSLDRTLTRLDPETGGVDARIAVGSEPQRVAAGEGAVWVTVRAPGAEDG